MAIFGCVPTPFLLAVHPWGLAPPKQSSNPPKLTYEAL